jgi:two-component system, NtrC family, sensor kinase
MSKASILLRPLGLRAEVIANLCLLLAAALLISGLLLLRITERELLRERISRLVDITETMARPLGEQRVGSGGFSISGFHTLPAELALEDVFIVDEDVRPIAGHARAGADTADMRRAIISRSPEVRVFYPDFWLPFVAGEDRTVRITLPLIERTGRITGALQARFSLATVRRQVLDAQKLVLLTMGAAWILFVLIGLSLLSRNVIGPIRRLKDATARIARGDLDHGLPEKGTREVAELAASFNQMSTSLKRSREQTAETITSLIESNEALAQTRQELIRSEKMASVGHLAAGMAHEIGNPLSAAIGYLELLKRKPSTPHEQDLCRRTLDELERIDRLVRDLLDYAAPANAAAELLDPLQVAADAVHLLENQGAFGGIRVALEASESLPRVRIERHKLTQVFVNLLLNARDALGENGGVIGLSIDGHGDEVVLSVHDDGAGMAPEVSSHIFDPFFTTKGPGQGRGLGLSVCHRIIDEAGGSIEVLSTPGAGSVFRIRLPKGRTEERRNGYAKE